MKKIDPIYSEHLFRPIYELNTATAWLGGGLATPFLSQIYSGGGSLPTALTIGGGMLATGAYHGIKALPLLKRQLKLTTNKKTFMSVKELRKLNNLEKIMTSGKVKEKWRTTYIGNGYNWGSEHANRAYQVMDMDSNMSQVELPFFLKPIVKAMLRETEDLGGKPWIHGMGDEKLISVNESNWFGHTCITGNVGTGKTVLLKMISVNALHMGDVLVILDPKNDPDWKEAVQKEMEYLGMSDRFYHLHPAKPSTSVRIPLLKNYTRITEIADRIAPLMGSSGTGKAFQDFAYEIIYFTAQGLHYLGEPIRLTTIQKVISSNRRGLAMRVMDKFYRTTIGENYAEQLADEFADINADRLAAMAGYYNQYLINDHECKAVEGMIQFALHDEGHYAKMVVSLRPVLTSLTAEPLHDLFSPIDDIHDSEDKREIVDLADVMERGGCIYISLDSMTDSSTAGFLSRLLLAELAAIAGSRYNSEDKNPRRVTIANDEVHASIENNDAMMNMLAQGRAASMQMFLATQTISDIEAKTDAATARRFLGLCNNFISMRTTDPATQEYVAAQFAKASVAQQQIRSGTFTDTKSSVLDFSSGYQETLMKTREDAFPPTLLGDLPKLQYVARLADGKRLKMRLPILLNDDEDGEVAPWAA